MNPKIDERIKEEYETKMKGKFKIYLGDELYAEGKNTWTRWFCIGLVSALGPPDYGIYGTEYAKFMGYHHTARVGTDTVTPTDPTMSSLVDAVDTEPDAKSSVLFKSVDYMEYTVRFKYVWTTGTLPDMTIGELGVYSCLPMGPSDGVYEGWTVYGNSNCAGIEGGFVYFPFKLNGGAGGVIKLASRVSSADGDFDPIDYTSEEALIFEWYVTIKF